MIYNVYYAQISLQSLYEFFYMDLQDKLHALNVLTLELILTFCLHLTLLSKSTSLAPPRKKGMRLFCTYYSFYLTKFRSCY